tara:strand:+ start:282 stop:473 length:192 start_codon:yes stop_codon:yes gene_type:complete
MTLVFALLILAAIAIVGALYGHGYPETIDAIAYRLHVHAGVVRAMQDERRRVVRERWIKEMER